MLCSLLSALCPLSLLLLQLSSELIANKHAFVVPELPAKKWSLLSQDTSPEYLAQRQGRHRQHTHDHESERSSAKAQSTVGELICFCACARPYLVLIAAAYSLWLHQLLGGGARKICLFPSVRTFLELDRQLIKPPVEDDDDDDEDQSAATAAATTMTDN